MNLKSGQLTKCHEKHRAEETGPLSLCILCLCVNYRNSSLQEDELPKKCVCVCEYINTCPMCWIHNPPCPMDEWLKCAPSSKAGFQFLLVPYQRRERWHSVGCSGKRQHLQYGWFNRQRWKRGNFPERGNRKQKEMTISFSLNQWSTFRQNLLDIKERTN